MEGPPPRQVVTRWRPLGPRDCDRRVSLTGQCEALVGGGGSVWQSAPDAILSPLSPDLPVLEERAWRSETLEGHDCPAPAACGPVAPAEGLSGAKGGPGDRGLWSPSCPPHFMHRPSLAPLPW